MKKTFIIIMVIMVALFSSKGVLGEKASAMSCSSAKFISRMEQRNEYLMSMKEDLSNIKGISKNKEKSESLQMQSDMLEKSDEYYISRMEKKLGLLVAETIGKAENNNSAVLSPMMTHNLLPESRMKKLKKRKN